MGIFSPYALAAGFEGDDLATSLRTKKLKEAELRNQMQDAQKQRMARELLGRVLQNMGGQQPGMIPQSPAPGQASVPMQRPQGFAPMRAGGDMPAGPDTGIADRVQGLLASPEERDAAFATAAPRADGSAKGNGFLGVLKRPDGQVSSELSIGVNIDGKEVEIPLMVPTLTRDEINTVLSIDPKTGGYPRPIIDKAVAFARNRIGAGQSPFAGSSEPGAGATPSPGGPPAQPGTGAAPGAGTMAPQRMPFSWQQVAEEVRKRTDAPPDVVFAAMQEIMPQIDKDMQHDFQRTQQEALLQQKREAQLNALNIQYSRATTELEKAQIRASSARIVAEMRGDASRDVAGIQAGSRERVAGMNNSTKLDVADRNNLARAALADVNNQTREKIAANGLALKKELGEGALDVAADKVAKTFIVQQRKNDLIAQGLDEKDAQFYANLEANQAKWALNDETTRRGQDLVHSDRVAAETGKNVRNQAGLDAKTLVQRNTAARGLDGAIERMDDMAASAKALLSHPGLDGAVGPVASRLPTFRDDSANFEAALDSLASEKGLAVIQAMRSANPGGGTGFSRITNFELQQFQNSVASLKAKQSPEAMRESLLKLLDFINRSKTRLVTGYQKEYGNAGQPKAAGGAVPATAPGQGGGGAGAISTPKEVADEPDGTVFEMKGKQYKKQGTQSVPVQ